MTSDYLFQKETVHQPVRVCNKCSYYDKDLLGIQDEMANKYAPGARAFQDHRESSGTNSDEEMEALPSAYNNYYIFQLESEIRNAQRFLASLDAVTL